MPERCLTVEIATILPNIEIGAMIFMIKENYVYVGIDLHKETHTAVMIEKVGRDYIPKQTSRFS